MSNPSLKNSIDRLKGLELEKLRLLAEVEDLRKKADAKADALANEIAALREEINSIKGITDIGKPQLLSYESVKERNLISLRELAKKTVDESSMLGSQVFAVSPFKQHFDGWLNSLRQTVLNFESHSPIMVDEQFVKDRSQIFLDLEAALSQKGAEESNLNLISKTLADNDRLLAETDREYAEKAKDLSTKRDQEIERLTSRVNQLESEVKQEEEDSNKRKILGKKKTDDRLPQTRQDLKVAKNELDIAKQNFAAEGGKLLIDYEKKKQDLTKQVETLRREVERLGTDTSIEARQVACRSLANAVNSLVERTASIV